MFRFGFKGQGYGSLKLVDDLDYGCDNAHKQRNMFYFWVFCDTTLVWGLFTCWSLHCQNVINFLNNDVRLCCDV